MIQSSEKGRKTKETSKKNETSAEMTKACRRQEKGQKMGVGSGEEKGGQKKRCSWDERGQGGSGIRRGHCRRSKEKAVGRWKEQHGARKKKREQLLCVLVVEEAGSKM